MDTALHRASQAKRGELVNSSPDSQPSNVLPNVVSIAEGYERWAATYDEFPNPLLAREERHVLTMLPDLKGKTVLDLACGTGRWLGRMLTRGATLGVGIDASSAMLRVATKKADIRRYLAGADCLSLPFPESVFDFAICSFAAGHIGDVSALAVEVARVLKPMSDLFVTDLHSQAYASGWRTSFRDEQSAVEIETIPYTAESLIVAFHRAHWECMTHSPLCLGPQEKPIFRLAGKLRFYEEYSRVPAILFCHFRKRRSKTCPRLP